ncbi:hypothetical protein Hanom_Chr05g00413871 [Helianthus anomalus]
MKISYGFANNSLMSAAALSKQVLFIAKKKGFSSFLWVKGNAVIRYCTHGFIIISRSGKGIYVTYYIMAGRIS